MAGAATDRDWEFFGRTDPYWSVFTQERYRRANLTEDAVRDFFASGEQHIDFVLATVRDHLDGGFAPRSALDFGCGVGRMVVPLARRCGRVVGVDVADAMLAE